MTAIALARRCALAAALAWVLLVAPVAAQRPMFGYEAPHQKAQRLRAQAAAAARPPRVVFAREQPLPTGRPEAAAQVEAPAQPRRPAVEMSFWGEAVPLDSVQTASAQLDGDFEVLGDPEAPDSSILVNPPYLAPGEVLVDEMPGAPGVIHHGLMDQGVIDDGMIDHDGMYTACDSCAAGSHCQGARCGGCASCQSVLNWFEVFGGSQAFTGPMNIGQTGSFGFHEGFNVGVPFTLLGARDLSAQLGVRIVHSNISSAAFTTRERTQFFLTTGLFRRVDQGYQYGLVLDYLHDDWYADPDLVQLRGEFAYLWNPAGEVGFWFNASTQRSSVQADFSGPNATPVDGIRTYEATDVYAFYLRRRFGPALTSTARFFTGFTGVNDGLLGADFEMPFNPGWALQAGAVYLIPAQGVQNEGYAQESWNVFVGAVWRPRGFAQGDYQRPLFRVADNGLFFVDRTQ